MTEHISPVLSLCGESLLNFGCYAASRFLISVVSPVPNSLPVPQGTVMGLHCAARCFLISTFPSITYSVPASRGPIVRLYFSDFVSIVREVTSKTVRFSCTRISAIIRDDDIIWILSEWILLFYAITTLGVKTTITYRIRWNCSYRRRRMALAAEYSWLSISSQIS